MEPFFAHASVVDSFLVLELDEEMSSSVLGVELGQEAVRVLQNSLSRQLELQNEHPGAVVEYLVFEVLVLERQVD